MIHLAKSHYGKHFQTLFDYYLQNGIVYSDKYIFVMAMLHNKNFLMENKKQNNLDKLDCYYIHYAIGDMKRLFEIAPKKVEWVVFERGNKPLKCYKYERIRSLIYGQTTNTASTTSTSTSSTSS